MVRGLETLARLNYSGRIIILGRDLEGRQLVGYAPTVRSKDNQRRKIGVCEGTHQLRVDPIDPEQLKRPDADLVFYPAMSFNGRGVAISNGVHTMDIEHSFFAYEVNPLPGKILGDAFANLLPEPDALGTPRIGGCVTGDRIGFAIVRKVGRRIERAVYDFQGLEPGQCFFMRTYDGTGLTMDDPKTYLGGPEEINLAGRNSRENCHLIMDVLKPKFSAEKDLRVAVAVVTSTPGDEIHEPQRNGYIVNHVAGEEFEIGEF
jgi:IMP cyclohydrolase